MEFWKEHVGLRMILITAFFVAGLFMVIIGWKMTGKLAGLGLMIIGVVFLLTALSVYNKPFETPKKKG